MKSILSLLVCLLATVSIFAQQNDYLASNDDYSLIDVRSEKIETKTSTAVVDDYMFKSGILHALNNNAESVSLTYVEVDENVNYKFTITNRKGEIFKEFRFVELKKNDLSISLDFTGLAAGPYIVQIEKDQLLVEPVIADNEK